MVPYLCGQAPQRRPCMQASERDMERATQPLASNPRGGMQGHHAQMSSDPQGCTQGRHGEINASTAPHPRRAWCSLPCMLPSWSACAAVCVRYQLLPRPLLRLLLAAPLLRCPVLRPAQQHNGAGTNKLTACFVQIVLANSVPCVANTSAPTTTARHKRCAIVAPCFAPMTLQILSLQGNSIVPTPTMSLTNPPLTYKSSAHLGARH